MLCQTAKSSPNKCWEEMSEMECVNIFQSINADPSVSSYKQCWRCNICNFILQVKSTILKHNGLCFRCKEIRFKIHETKTFWHKYWKQPSDFYWMCFDCKNLNTNVKSHWCTFGECLGRKIVFIANEIPYKPSCQEIQKEESRIINFNVKLNKYVVHLRLCLWCGCRCGNVICSICDHPKQILIYTMKMQKMIQGFIRNIFENVPVNLVLMICKYFSG